MARALHLNVANASCPGETSASLLDTNAPSNGCENSPGSPHSGYRTAFPLHVNYTGSQIDFAVSYLTAHKDVRLVTLMIGANDFFLCQETTSDGCSSSTEQAAVAGGGSPPTLEQPSRPSAGRPITAGGSWQSSTTTRGNGRSCRGCS